MIIFGNLEDWWKGEVAGKILIPSEIGEEGIYEINVGSSVVHFQS